MTKLFKYLIIGSIFCFVPIMWWGLPRSNPIPARIEAVKEIGLIILVGKMHRCFYYYTSGFVIFTQYFSPFVETGYNYL